MTLNLIKIQISGDDAYWCSSYNIIKPNVSNPIWNTIEKYSKDTKRHYRHDLVQAGICIKWCLNSVEHLDNETLNSLYEPEFDFGGPVSLTQSIQKYITYCCSWVCLSAIFLAMRFSLSSELWSGWDKMILRWVFIGR